MPRILIIDDERGFAEALVVLLRDAGYQVETAPDGRQGLNKLARKPPDVVLLDFMMPVLDGPGVLQAMRKSPKLRRVPVIMMSAIEESIVRKRCQGQAGFLRKPFEVTRLTSLLQHLLAPATRAVASR